MGVVGKGFLPKTAAQQACGEYRFIGLDVGCPETMVLAILPLYLPHLAGLTRS
jgi:hypothetical protein